MKNLILCLLSLFLLFGCGSRSRSSSEAADVANSVELNVDSLALSRVFSPAMRGAIDVFNQYVKKQSEQSMFTEIRFYEQGKECFFSISEAPHYFDFAVLGYIKLNDRLYVVDNPVRLNKAGGWMTLQEDGTAIMNVPELNCMDNFVNTSELVPFIDSLPGYSESDGSIFDPIGVRYKIISPDSINLVHVGYI